jgi:DNA gyrase subunit A
MAINDALIEHESQERYLTYAMSVISGRALPDVRDGLKPVQRRILYSMFKRLHLYPDRAPKKSATIVGDVIGKFHPHGDVPCYEAMVRMAQSFSLRYPLVDGQGNFGSLDGDSAAAYRYTEARLREIAMEVVGEIDEETVPFRPNFDATEDEPVVFPSRIPNLLINGASGIAVGMATNIPPHNLKDTVKAIVELSKDSEITVTQLANIVKAPDFPTGCLILNTKKELQAIYETGRGAVRMRGEWSVEDQARGRRAVIVSAIPFGVNKAQLVEKIADLIIQKKVPQLVDIRDESTDDVRVVIELANGAEAEVAMAYLFKYTPLESAFQVNLTALVPTSGGGLKPELLSLKACLQHFLDFRVEVTRLRLEFEKKKLLERMHILEGLCIVYDDLDTAIKIVRKSSGRSDSAEKLRAHFKLTEIQSFAVVDMHIHQISRTSIDEIKAELKAKAARVEEINKILAKKEKILALVISDLEAIAEKFGDRRRCKLSNENIEIEFRPEDYVVEEEVYAIVTRDGWVKRIRQAQDITGTRLRDGDSVLRAHPISTRDLVVFLTSAGSVYTLKGADFPSSSGYGDPIQKLLKFKDGEQVVESFFVAEKKSDKPRAQEIQPGAEVVLVTKAGMASATTLTDLAEIKRNGRKIMKVRDGDAMVAATLATAPKLAVVTRSGMALVVDQKEIPRRDGAAVGVILIAVKDDDGVVSAVCCEPKVQINLNFGSGASKTLALKEIPEGSRATKGKKIISSGEVRSISVAH